MKKLIAMVILFSSMAIAQVNNPGTSFPDPGSAGLCWVSTGATTYAWGSCSGAASAAFSAITGSTNTTAAMVIGTGASLATSGSGTIAATTSTKWAVARTLAGNSVDGSANVAFPNKFLVQGTADAGLSGAQFMGALGTGIVKNATTTGVQSIAAAGTDYVDPSTTVNGKALSANITLGLASADFANQGTTTTLLHGNGAGNPSFAGVAMADLASKLGTGTKVATTSATAPVAQKCLEMDTSGNVVIAASNAACGSGGGMANPMTTLGDIIYEDVTPTAARLAGPTATNGVPQTLTSTPSGGAAVAPVWAVAGVGTNAQTGTTYTVAATDRTSYVSFSNAGAIAVTLPQAGTTGFASNFAFDACAIGAGTVTFTPTTSNISYSSGTAYSAAQATMALTTGQCAFIYSDNTNYFAFKIQGAGGVTSIATTSPITGGTITTTGTIACATCVTSAAALTSNAVVIGGGGQASSTISADTTTTHALMATAGAPAFRALVAGDLPATLSSGTAITNAALTTPRTSALNDANGNPFIASSATASAVDSVTITNAATANPATVTVGATGSDSNINLSLVPKGTGNVLICPACTNAGFYQFGQGTTNSLGTTAVTIQAPTSVTSYSITLPGAAANGIPRWANSANVVTESTSELSGDAATSGSNAVTVSRMNGVAVLRVVMTADWTCGTGGVSSSCTAATIVGTGGTPLTITLPSVTASYHWQCDGVVGQATAATANSWNVITATNAPTNLEATYQMNTAATAMTGGAVTGVSATTTTVISPTWTLGGTATKMPFHVQGSIEGASASGTVISLQLVAPTVADLVTVYRGTSCSVAPF